MPLQGPKVSEIKEEFGREMAVLLTKTFDARVEAAQSEPNLDPNLTEGLSTAELRGIRAAHHAQTNQELYDSLRDEYEAKDLELRAAVEEREKLIYEYLAPKEASSEALGQFMSMSEEGIIQAADVAAGAGMVDTLRLLLSVSQSRDLDMAEHHVAGLMEEDGWPDLLTELFEASQVKELDEEAANQFELMAAEPGDKVAFLRDEQSDTNLYGRMR
jgi:hypothetical protein